LLRILIDGEKIKSLQLPFKVNLGALDIPGGVIGADLNGENGASFDLYTIMSFKTTLISSDIAIMMNWALKYHQPSGRRFVFNGKQWMRINEIGRRDFVQKNPSLQPILK
jgi:hypothetical protein